VSALIVIFATGGKATGFWQKQTISQELEKRKTRNMEKSMFF